MIIVNNVTKYYGTHRAVSDLNFTINEGECVGFLGLNGAGKTTTLNILSCLLLPTTGHVTVRGVDIEENPHEIRKLIGYLPDRPPLYEEMTVVEYLQFAGQLRHMSKVAVKGRVPDVLDLCGLGAVQNQPIGTLSHGYRQRVGIAQAIIHRPALLILDEPIQGLDPVQIVEMRQMIRSLRGEHTILLSSHILSEIEQTCDRLLMMHEGRIAAEGTEGELSNRYRGATAVSLEVRGTEEQVRLALASVPGVRNVEVAPGAEGVQAVQLHADTDVREAVGAAIVHANLGLLSLRQTGGRLESIFVSLSQGRDGSETRASSTEESAA